ncbi:MAG: formylglycine-generating enzyme family protein [Deltaproteobacteria bacterium]|nr:formylglycine-generating enzyme family protein [Deltaproteobacteria bacterium]
MVMVTKKRRSAGRFCSAYTGMVMLAVWALVVAGSSSCSDDLGGTSSSCEGVACSGHGTCRVTGSGSAVCDCQGGYEAVGLSCMWSGDAGTGDAGTGDAGAHDGGKDGAVSCTPENCSQGCCDEDGLCHTDETDWRCGQGGSTCANCTALNMICDSFASQCVPDPNGLKWVLISGGTFSMGSKDGRLNERPVHDVTVPTFVLTKSEVTVTQYGLCVTAGSCTEPGTGNPCNWSDPSYDDHPVNCVDWKQARDFCEWAGGRLPTEAEWEYAARSGGQQGKKYPWGDEAPTTICTYAVWNRGCGTGRSWPICSTPAGNTEDGLCDMAGNVWEWVADFYHQTYHDAPIDGSAWINPITPNRVARGGGYIVTYPDTLRTAYRLEADPTSRNESIGFRCAR